MFHRLAADAVLIFHLLFILFVVFGGLVVIHHRWAVWLHVPVAGWGAFIELSGRICPLTTIEVSLRRAAGQAGYDDSFVEHYLYPIIYPTGLTRGIQFWLAGIVVVANVLIYAWIWRRNVKPSE